MLPLVGRVMAAFEHWLVAQYDEVLTLDYDADALSALASRRDHLWDKLQQADFITINEKRAALGYGPLEGRDVLAAAQPRTER